MCGIHLILDKRQQLRDASAITAMMQAGRHRGPDAQHYHHLKEEGLWLAGNRLQIVDHDPAAHQPMRSPEGRYALIYNGEIYNYYDLRNRLLQAGEHFTTHSDTEVLLKCLMQEGAAALPTLEGMFAFAFYDRQTKQLLAARDPFGMKPLYYYEDTSWLILSSETQSLMASGLLVKEFNADQVDHYLRFRYTAPGYTFFKGIYQVLPGHRLDKSADQATVQHPYDVPVQDSAAEAPAKSLVAHTKTLLTDAVVKHLAAAVPCGLFLSGGVDSTLLLAIIQQEGLHPIPSFSVVHDPADKSFGTRDYQYAAQAAKMYGNLHYELRLTPELVAEQQEDFLQYLDQPVADSGAFMTYLLSKEAKKAVGVVLSGAGADELFAGYHRHQAFYWYLKHQDTIGLAQRLFPLTRYLPTGFPHPLRQQFRLIKKLGTNLTHRPASTFQNFISLDMPGRPDADHESTTDHSLAQHFSQALRHDLTHYLPNDVLTISDRMSMASGLEMRMPYLDAPLARFVQRIPAVFRIDQGRKWILKQILEGYGGKTFAERSKEGFGLPLGGWIRNGTLDFFMQPLLQTTNAVYQHVAFEKVQQMMQKHQLGKADYSQELWAVGVLAAWMSSQFSERT